MKIYYNNVISNLFFRYCFAIFFIFIYLFFILSFLCKVCIVTDSILVVRRYKYDVDVGGHGIPSTNENDDNYGAMSVHARGLVKL